MNATIINKTSGKITEVKNLGWLLRNHKNVTSLELLADLPRKGYSNEGCLLIAQTKNGLEYRCECASFSIMHKWVRRPCLSHVIKSYRFPTP